MKKFVLIVSLLAGLAICARAVDVDAGIQKTIDGFSAAWAKHDVKEMASAWADDGDLVNPFGRVATGHAELEKLFSEEHATAFKASTIEMKPTSARTLAEGLVLMDGDCNIKNATLKDGSTDDLSYHITWIFKKTGNAWKLLAVRPYAFLK